MRLRHKIYISGPITGIRRCEYMKRFSDVEEMLRVRGYRVCNPTKLLPCRWWWIYPSLEMLIGSRLAYRFFVAYDLCRLRHCDGILFMWGSERSRGSRLERMKARQWGIDTITF